MSRTLDNLRFQGITSVEDDVKTLDVEAVVRFTLVDEVAGAHDIHGWKARRVELPDRLDAAILVNVEWLVLRDLPGELQAGIRDRLKMPPRCTCGEEGSDPPLPHKTWCQKAE